MRAGAAFWLSAFSGSPRVYLSPDRGLPGPRHATNADGNLPGAPLYVAPQKGNRSFLLAVTCGEVCAADATFTLVAKTGNGVQMLQDRAPVRGELQSTEQQQFKVTVPQDAGAARVVLTVFSGTIDVRVWTDEEGCARQDTSASCSTLRGSATGTPAAPATLPLPATALACAHS